ncbi:Putative aminoacrylate hydrolase RutD [Streptomyces canarius]
MSETPSNTLQYRFDGPEEAPVLILGPSLGTTWHMWDRQVPELAKQWRVFRFDLPGHGGAPAHPAGSVAELSARLLATLDALGVQRFGYAGCALGGAIGIELALRHPARLASLAVVAASPRFGTADEFRQRGVVVRTNGLDPIARTAPDRWFTGGFAAAQPAITEWAVRIVRTTDPGCYIAACEALAYFDVRPELGRVGVPTLVLVGSDDQVTGPAEARTLVAGIPDARLAVVPGASTWCRSSSPPPSPTCSSTTSPPPGSSPTTPASRPAGRAGRPGPGRRAAARAGRRDRPGRRTGAAHRAAGPVPDRAEGPPARCWATPTWTGRWHRPTSSPGTSRSSSPATPGARSGTVPAWTAVPAAASRSPRWSRAATWRSWPSTPGRPCATGSPRTRSRKCCSRRPSTAGCRPRTARSGWPSR